MADTRLPPPRIELVLDCHDVDLLAEFWTAALGYRPHGMAGTYRSLVSNTDDGRPKLILQRVPETKQLKNRMHLDMLVTDIEAEASRLERLGARREQDGTVDEHGTRWVRMQDPEGNEFCVCRIDD